MVLLLASPRTQGGPGRTSGWAGAGPARSAQRSTRGGDSWGPPCTAGCGTWPGAASTRTLRGSRCRRRPCKQGGVEAVKAAKGRNVGRGPVLGSSEGRIPQPPFIRLPSAVIRTTWSTAKKTACCLRIEIRDHGIVPRDSARGANQRDPAWCACAWCPPEADAALVVGAGHGQVLDQPGVAPPGILSGVRKGAGPPVVHIPLAAARHLRGGARESSASVSNAGLRATQLDMAGSTALVLQLQACMCSNAAHGKGRSAAAAELGCRAGRDPVSLPTLKWVPSHPP